MTSAKPASNGMSREADQPSADERSSMRVIRVCARSRLSHPAQPSSSESSPSGLAFG